MFLNERKARSYSFQAFLFLSVFVLFSSLLVQAEDLEFGVEEQWQDTPARVTRAALTEMVRTGQAEIVEVRTAEAMKIAAAHGVVLNPAKTGYDHPWFIVRAGVGLPNLVSAHLEVFVSDHLTLEVGTGAGLLPSVYEGSIRWRPSATCFNCRGRNLFSIGFGIDPGFYTYNSSLGVMLVASVDATYILRAFEHFGIAISTRAGAGVVTEFRPDDEHSGRIEPVIKIELLSLGLVF